MIQQPNKAGPLGNTDIFINIFNEVNNKYKKGHTTEEKDQLSEKVALAISE